MKICQFINGVRCGGAEILAINLALHAQRSGHEATLLTIAPIQDNQDIFTLHVVDELLHSKVLVLSLSHSNTGIWGKLIFFFRFWNILRKNRFDIIHSHSPRCDVINALFHFLSLEKYRSISTIHSSVISRNTLIDKIDFFCHRHILESYFCGKEAYEANVDILPTSKFVANGVSMAMTVNAIPKASLLLGLNLPQCTQKMPWILSVSRLSKNRLPLIQTISIAKKKGKNWVLLMCGDGEERSGYEQLCRELSISDRVFFLGLRNDVEKFLQAADLFASSSTYEGLPLSVLEAAGSGLPCVLSPIPPHQALAEEINDIFITAQNTGEGFFDTFNYVFSRQKPKELILKERHHSLQKYTMASCYHAYYEIKNRCSD